MYAAIVTGPVISANDVEQRFSEFYKLRSVNRKSGLVLSAAKSVLDDLRYKALVRLWRRFKAAANRRTDVAHCVFMFMNSQGLSRLSTSGPKPHFEPLQEAYFDRTTLQFRTLSQDIGAFLTFVVGTEDRLLQLLRALPLPPDTPFPPEAEAPPAPSTPDAKSELKASVSRLGLLSLYHE